MRPGDTMGQCQYCTRTTMTTTDSASHKEGLNNTHDSSGRNLGSDSALDSGHSSGDEASCGGGGGGGGGSGGGGSGANGSVANGASSVGNGISNPVNDVVEEPGRSSHSSDSSGKYSLRDSVGSCGDCGDRSNFSSVRIDESGVDMPVFYEEKDVIGDCLTNVIEEGDSLHPPPDHTRQRKVSRGSRSSRGSSSSERGSFSSVTSVTAILKARLERSSSLTVQGSQNDVHGQCSPSSEREPRHPQRTVSLRLPNSHKRHHDTDTNLPTIYVDDSPQSQNGHRQSRKSSIRRALSLLSMNSLMRHEAASVTTQQKAQKNQKPVQKILRQPRRRHNTVRGLSGMAIDGSNQSAACSGLHRANTVYYPTATSLRYSTTRRPLTISR